MSFEWKICNTSGKLEEGNIIVINYVWFRHVLVVDDNSLDLYKVIDKDKRMRRKFIYIFKMLR